MCFVYKKRFRLRKVNFINTVAFFRLKHVINICTNLFNYSVVQFSFSSHKVSNTIKKTGPIINKKHLIKVTAKLNHVFVRNWINGDIVSVPRQITMGLKHCTESGKMIFSVTPVFVTVAEYCNIKTQHNTGPLCKCVVINIVLNSDWTLVVTLVTA